MLNFWTYIEQLYRKWWYCFNATRFEKYQFEIASWFCSVYGKNYIFRKTGKHWLILIWENLKFNLSIEKIFSRQKILQIQIVSQYSNIGFVPQSNFWWRGKSLNNWTDKGVAAASGRIMLILNSWTHRYTNIQCGLQGNTKFMPSTMNIHLGRDCPWLGCLQKYSIMMSFKQKAMNMQQHVQEMDFRHNVHRKPK